MKRRGFLAGLLSAIPALAISSSAADAKDVVIDVDKWWDEGRPTFCPVIAIIDADGIRHEQTKCYYLNMTTGEYKQFKKDKEKGGLVLRHDRKDAVREQGFYPAPVMIESQDYGILTQEQVRDWNL